MIEDSPILADLRTAYATGNLIVFVGAGASAAAGLPTWSRLAEQMAERLRAERAPADAVTLHTQNEREARGKIVIAIAFLMRTLADDGDPGDPSGNGEL